MPYVWIKSFWSYHFMQVLNRQSGSESMWLLGAKINFYYRATSISRYFYFRLSKHIHMCMELWSMDRASNFLLDWSSSRSKLLCVSNWWHAFKELRDFIIFLLTEVHNQYFFITQLILVQFFWQLKNEIIYYSNIVQIEPPN